NPTILLLHGFPSTSYDWRHQIVHFTDQGYGILAPDLLGYGGTSKPTNVTAYKTKSMASEIIEILDHEGIAKVHGVGHDTGCTLLSRLADHFPERLLSCSFLEVPYMKPGVHFDLGAVNAGTKALLGFERFGYIGFFIKDEAGEVLDRFADSFFTLFYPDDPEIWAEHVGPTGAMERWLLEDRRGPLPSWITEEERLTHQSLLRGNHKSALNWYRALVWNINEEDEKQDHIEPVLSMPVLMLSSRPSKLDLPGMEEGMKQVASRLVVRRVSTAGHWVQLEAKDEVNEILGEFFEGVSDEGRI
ncbi:hypothetical protein BBP40_012378, partial [Aspergillus hancockii]